MVHLITGKGETEHISSVDVWSFNVGLAGLDDLVFKNGTAIIATVVSNNEIRISDGDAFLQGRHIRIPAGDYESMTIENGSQGLKR